MPARAALATPARREQWHAQKRAVKSKNALAGSEVEQSQRGAEAGAHSEYESNRKGDRIDYVRQAEDLGEDDPCPAERAKRRTNAE